MRLASAADFEQGGMYDPPYRRYPFFAERSQQIAKLGASGMRALVVGCGWGYLVEELRALGFDAWGCDASPYAVTKAQEVLPAPVVPFIMQADATNRTELNAVRTAMGLGGGQRITAVITEDMLPCLTESELTLALTELRRIATQVLHFITCSKPDIPGDADTRQPGLLWKSPSEWRARIGAQDLIYDCEGYGEVP